MDYKDLSQRKEQLQITTEQLAYATHLSTGIINRLLRGELEAPPEDALLALEQALFPEHFPDNLTADTLKESQSAWKTSPIGPYTLEDYLALPDDVRAELIDGEIIYMEAPTVTHQGFLAEIFFVIQSYIRSNKGSCRVYFAPLDVQLDCDDKTMVQPDIIVICDHDKITRKRIYGAPEFCIKVMSPATRNHDRKTKLRKYRFAGVREYWMVDMERRQVICYFFENAVNPTIYPFEKPVPVRIFDNKLTINFAQVDASMPC